MKHGQVKAEEISGITEMKMIGSTDNLKLKERMTGSKLRRHLQIEDKTDVVRRKRRV